MLHMMVNVKIKLVVNMVVCCFNNIFINNPSNLCKYLSLMYLYQLVACKYTIYSSFNNFRLFGLDLFVLFALEYIYNCRVPFSFSLVTDTRQPYKQVCVLSFFKREKSSECVMLLLFLKHYDVSNVMSNFLNDQQGTDLQLLTLMKWSQYKLNPH